MKHFAQSSNQARAGHCMSRLQQRGNIAVWLAFTLGMIFYVLATKFDNDVLYAQKQLSKSASSYLSNAAVLVTTWYSTNAVTIDNPTLSVPTSAQVSATIPYKQYGVQVSISNQLGLPCSDTTSISCIGYHVIALWLPPTGHADHSSFSVTTGVFTPDPDVLGYRLISGLSIQANLMAITSSFLSNAGTALTNYYQVREELGGTSTNYFAAVDCSNPQAGEIPCMSTPTDVTTITPSLTKLTGATFANAWGLTVYVKNQPTTVPYTFILSTVTPWSSTVSTTVYSSI